MLYKICYLDIPSVLSVFYVCTTKEDIIYWMSVKMSWMKSKLNINIGIILLMLKIVLSFVLIKHYDAFADYQFVEKIWYSWFMVLEYCLLSRRRHYMITESHYSSFSSFLFSRLYLYKKNFSLSGDFCPFWCLTISNKEERGAWLAKRRGESQCFPKFIISWTINLPGPGSHQRGWRPRTRRIEILSSAPSGFKILFIF